MNNHSFLSKLGLSNNMGVADRISRGVLGALLALLSPAGIDLLGNGVIGWFCLFFGLANLISALTGWCFMYSIVGLNSRSGFESDEASAPLRLNYSSLRRKTVVGFSAISLLISALYVAEGYESAKDTVQRMELKQLHSVIMLVMDEIHHIVEAEKIDVSNASKAFSAEELLQTLYHFDAPMMLAVQDKTGWIQTSKNLDPAIAERLFSQISANISGKLAGKTPISAHEDLLSSSEPVDNYFIAIDDQQFVVMHHDLIGDNGNARVYLTQRSLGARYVFNTVTSRLLTSSVVVIWLAIWGAVGVAFFIWRYVEVANRRVLTAANTDSQTGLINERALRELFATQIDADSDINYLVAAAKFRNLSQIVADNSSAIASQLLHQLAAQLRQAMSERCILARLNDGTFVLVVPATECGCLEQFRTLINQTQQLENYQFSLEPTEALVRYRNDVSSFDELLSALSILIYSANKKRLASVTYDERLIRSSEKVSQYAAEIRTALEQKQFELYLQPKLDPVSREVLGAEALIRWNHPRDGLLSPFSFLEIVEKSNARSSFAKFVIEESARLALAFRTKGFTVPISFNLNGYDVMDDQVLSILEELAGSLPEKIIALLEIELTESETSINVGQIGARLQRITSLGYSIALDDFGTGMSSFSFCHQLPINTIKIDRSFIAMLSASEESQRPTKTILYLAQNYGYQVVAEGVETDEQRQILTELGCTSCQGYLFARPMRYSDLLSFLAT